MTEKAKCYIPNCGGTIDEDGFCGECGDLKEAAPEVEEGTGDSTVDERMHAAERIGAKFTGEDGPGPAPEDFSSLGGMLARLGALTERLGEVHQGNHSVNLDLWSDNFNVVMTELLKRKGLDVNGVKPEDLPFDEETNLAIQAIRGRAAGFGDIVNNLHEIDKSIMLANKIAHAYEEGQEGRDATQHMIAMQLEVLNEHLAKMIEGPVKSTLTRKDVWAALTARK